MVKTKNVIIRKNCLYSFYVRKKKSKQVKVFQIDEVIEPNYCICVIKHA